MLNRPRDIFGLHSFTAFNRDTGLPYGTVRILGSLEAGADREMKDLTGGSNPNIWDSEHGNITSDITFTLREFNPFLYTLAGYTVTENAAEANGAISEALANKYGTSVLNASTGIASVGIKSGSEADVKTSQYVVKVVSPTTVDVYAIFDTDFKRGTDADFVDNLMKITSAPLTITASTPVEIPNFGLELTGGSGTIGMTIGDTAVFSVRAANEASYSYEYKDNPTPIEFGAVFTSQKKANGEFMIHKFPRMILSNVPKNLTEKEWSEISLNMRSLYDNTAGYSYKGVDVVKDLV